MTIARAQNELEAARGALDHIGEPTIASLDAAYHRARACKRNLAKARAETLCMHDFNFASRWEQLTDGEEGSAGNFKYRFPLPPGCLIVREVEGLEENSWTTEQDDGGSLVTLATDAESPKIRYTGDVGNLALWDPLAFATLELVLGAKINPAVGKNSNLTKDLLAQAKLALKPAKQMDARQQSRGSIRRDTSWLDARRTGGSRGRR